jgi:DNA-binding transcriptional ArsR family regulator
MDKETQEESLEESVFKTLSHQKRRDILRVIGERREATFTEIKNSAEIGDSASLSYHLNALDSLIVQKGGRYRLTELGQDAYNLISKTATSAVSNFALSALRKAHHNSRIETVFLSLETPSALRLLLCTAWPHNFSVFRFVVQEQPMRLLRRWWSI